MEASGKARTLKLLTTLENLPKKIARNAGPEPVHKLRTTIRRLESMLDTAGIAQTGKAAKLLKQAARLRKRAGKVRDIDVQIQALKDVKVEAAARDRKRVMRALEKTRAKQESKLRAELESASDHHFRKHLNKTREEVEAASTARQTRPASDPVGQALDAFSELARQRGSLTETTLHDFRLRCKRLRYTAEMAGKTPAASAAIEQFIRIQDAAGEWHDWLTLTATAEDKLGRSSSPLVSALRTITRSKFLEAVRVTTDAERSLLAQREGRKRKAPSGEPAPSVEALRAAASVS
jgi:CHAD domain-containing protein